MTISEANAVNVVLRQLGVQPRYGSAGLPSRDSLLGAMRLLAEKAHKALKAGVTPDDVDHAWRRGKAK